MGYQTAAGPQAAAGQQTAAGQQVAMGQQAAVQQPTGAKAVINNVVGRAVDEVTNRMDSVYGATEHVDLEFGDFFSGVFESHTHEEAEEVFISGTAKTTPNIAVAPSIWHRPWFYSRVLVVMLVPYLLCHIMWTFFANANVLPGLMVFGSFAIPFATLVFYFEANVEQNISFMDVIRDFCIGGTLSLLIALPLFELIPGSGVGDMLPALLTGFIEELAKTLAITALIVHRGKPLSILNGILIGGAVGAGFAAFESAGYAFSSLLTLGGYDAMIHNIMLRGFLAVGGHVAWAALEGAGLAIASGDKHFEWTALFKVEFLVLFAVSTVCHGYWDWTPLADTLPIPYAEYALLVLVVWIVLLVMLRRGIAEVNTKARAAQGLPA